MILIIHTPLWRNAQHVGVNQSIVLGRVRASHLCHSGQTYSLGSGAVQWLPCEPRNIRRQIPEMAMKRNYTFNHG